MLIAASGRGQRMGGEIKKQYLMLEGVPILARTLDLFTRHRAVERIAVIVPPGETGYACDMLKAYCPLEKVAFIEGGRRRQDSVWRGLQEVSPEAEMVCIHDGVRPFVTCGLFDAVLKAALRYGAAVPVIPMTDTLKEISGSGMIRCTMSREKLVRAQTPQIFRRRLILDAYRRAQALGVEATDDAGLLELLGGEICAVAGSASNIKITDPLDLAVAGVLIKRGC